LSRLAGWPNSSQGTNWVPNSWSYPSCASAERARLTSRRGSGTAGWGPGGRRFKSCLPDQRNRPSRANSDPLYLLRSCPRGTNGEQLSARLRLGVGPIHLTHIPRRARTDRDPGCGRRDFVRSRHQQLGVSVAPRPGALFRKAIAHG
jgi:hypothetical protein